MCQISLLNEIESEQDVLAVLFQSYDVMFQDLTGMVMVTWSN